MWGKRPPPHLIGSVALCKMKIKPVWEVIKTAGVAWINDNAPRLGASLSFYTIFALSPLLVIIVFLTSLLFDRADVQSVLFDQLQGVFGSSGADAIRAALKASFPQQQGIVASLIAIGTLLVMATGLFVELQGALNAIWGVERKPGYGIRGFIMGRLLSFGMILCIGFLLLVSLVVSAIVSALGKYLSDLLPGMELFWMVTNNLVSLGIVSLLFAMIFKILPDVNISWRDVWVGAVVTGILFTVGKFLLGQYLGRNAAVSAYGAAGSVVLILLWVYYSSQILFFGAEITQVYAARFGTRLQPKHYAQWINPEKAQPAGQPRGKVEPKGANESAEQRQERLLTELRNQVEGMKKRRAEFLAAGAARGKPARET
jgi:membrane protein